MEKTLEIQLAEQRERIAQAVWELLNNQRHDLSDYHAGWHNALLKAIEVARGHAYKRGVVEKTIEIQLDELRVRISNAIVADCIEGRHQSNDDGMGALTSDPSVVYYPETYVLCWKCRHSNDRARTTK